jgi:putative DNA primase/helicase
MAVMALKFFTKSLDDHAAQSDNGDTTESGDSYAIDDGASTPASLLENTGALSVVTPSHAAAVSKGKSKVRGADSLNIITLSNVTASPIPWLCEPYFAVGMLSLISGDPGAGKTSVAMAISAALTLGQTPFTKKPREVSNVLYLTVENRPEELRSKFNSLGGNPELFHIVNDSIQLADTSRLRKAIQEKKAKLLVVDPIQSFLNVDSHRSNKTRPVFDALSRLAREEGCCIILIRHLNKSTSAKTAYRGQGGMDITGAARTELLVGPSVQDPGQYAMVQTKSNIGMKGPSIGFSFDDEKGFHWTGESTLTDTDLLLPVAKASGRNAEGEAMAFLVKRLVKGPVMAVELEAAATTAGISKGTLKRAKGKLNIVVKKIGLKGGWEWSLPEGTQLPSTPKP